MTKEIDTGKIQQLTREFLVALGDDPDREGLQGTPQRVAKMCQEIFRGMCYTNEEIAQLFSTTFLEEDTLSHGDHLVVVQDIPIFSYCEHHLALMYNMTVSVVYRPCGKVIGLSKIARIADMVGRRLQLQERIGIEIGEILSMVTGSNTIGVMLQGEHSCMTARGIQKPGTKTVTTYFMGDFETDSALRQEALTLLQGGNKR